MKVTKRVPKIDSDNMEGEIIENVSGNEEFKHVEFSYSSRPESIIFKDFCLEIPAGKTVALLGGSGSEIGMAIFARPVGTRPGPTLMYQVLPGLIRNKVGYGFFKKKNPKRVRVESGKPGLDIT